MDVDKENGVFRFDKAEVANFSLGKAEWPIGQPMDVVMALESVINYKLRLNPADFPIGADKNQVHSEHHRGVELQDYLRKEILPQIFPYLDEQMSAAVDEMLKAEE